MACRKKEGIQLNDALLAQWVLKITAYAERLLEDLRSLDWPESLKKLQTNWIGRSDGAKIYFQEGKHKSKLTVFTTRPDTLIWSDIS